MKKVLICLACVAVLVALYACVNIGLGPENTGTSPSESAVNSIIEK